MMPQPTITRLKLEHLEALHEISVGLDETWKKEEFSYFILHRCGYNWGLFIDGSLIVFFIGLLVKGDLDIAAVTCHARYRKHGLAFRLCSELLTTSDIESASLEVRADNLAAIGLYKKLCFQEVGVRKKYYHGKFDALRMTRLVRFSTTHSR